jgi:uncharacterized protein (TIGR02453 family)
MPEIFSKKTLDFLIELRTRNDRAWYQEHKDDYDRVVLKPFRSLVSALAPLMIKIDPRIETAPAVGKTISRIYRDSRFSNDKRLYRDRVWITFGRKIREAYDVPAFYFELTPSGYSYGAGFYYVSLKTMDRFREMIRADEGGFLELIGAVSRAGELTARGDLYKRSRYGGGVPEIAGWYDRKNIHVAANFDDVTEAFDFERLVSRLEAGYAALAGIYHFWCGAAFDDETV